MITYYENSGSSITPSLNTDIRVIAGVYYSNNPTTPINVIVPTASASNDYLVVEYTIGYDASLAFYSTQLQVNFPSSNIFYQNQCSIVSYVWDSNASYWIINDFRASSTSYSN
jgi:hypothetical protein